MYILVKEAREAMDKISTFISSNLKKEHDKSILDPSAIPQLEKMMQSEYGPRHRLSCLLKLGENFGPDVAATVFKFSDYSYLADRENISWMLAAEERHRVRFINWFDDKLKKPSSLNISWMLAPGWKHRTQHGTQFIDWFHDKSKDPSGIFFRAMSKEGRSLSDEFDQVINPLLQNDLFFIQGLIKEYGVDELQYASAELKNSPHFMYNMIGAFGRIEAVTGSYDEGEGMVFYYLHTSRFSSLLGKHTSDEVKDNSEFMLALVEWVANYTPVDYVLEHASERLKDNVEFVESFMSIREAAGFDEDWRYERGGKRIEIPSDSDFAIHCLEVNEYLPFFIHQIKSFDSSRPEDKILTDYKIKGLERMVEKGNLGKFCKYAQEFKCVQKNPNILSDSSPQAVLEMIKKEIAPLSYLFTKVRGEVRSILGIKSADQQNQNKKKGLCL